MRTIYSAARGVPAARSMGLFQLVKELVVVLIWLYLKSLQFAYSLLYLFLFGSTIKPDKMDVSKISKNQVKSVATGEVGAL